MNDTLFDPAKSIMTLQQAVEWRNILRMKNQTLAITNGCFDLLHRGHAEYLAKARSLADKLLVLVNSDDSVRTLKGPSRPLNCEYDRAYILASLKFVDACVVFNSQRCNAELDALKPDFYAKGGDYTLETLDPDERQALLDAGTRVEFIKFVPDHSTSSIIKKMTK